MQIRFKKPHTKSTAIIHIVIAKYGLMYILL